MLKIKLEKSKYKILCLGAHADDIEIGCGGTILKLIENNSDIIINWVIFCANRVRKKEALKSANLFLNNSKENSIIIENYRDGFFPYIGAKIKENFERLKQQISPDLIFTHYQKDLHQDHRLISELTWNTFRDNLILEYEIPKYDGDLGRPNLFVDLTISQCNKKIKYLTKSYQSQSTKHWFSDDTFLSILRIRGIQSNATSKYAEAFYCRKMIL